MSIKMLCPHCHPRGEFVFMLYSPKNLYYICPACKGVFTPPPGDDGKVVKIVEDEILSLMKEKHKSNLPAKDPIPAGEAARGGGSSKCKDKSRVGQMKKKTVKQLYNEL